MLNMRREGLPGIHHHTHCCFLFCIYYSLISPKTFVLYRAGGRHSIYMKIGHRSTLYQDKMCRRKGEVEGTRCCLPGRASLEGIQQDHGLGACPQLWQCTGSSHHVLSPSSLFVCRASSLANGLVRQSVGIRGTWHAPAIFTSLLPKAAASSHPIGNHMFPHSLLVGP